LPDGASVVVTEIGRRVAPWSDVERTVRRARIVLREKIGIVDMASSDANEREDCARKETPLSADGCRPSFA